jgi:hypothetical protein
MESTSTKRFIFRGEWGEFVDKANGYGYRYKSSTGADFTRYNPGDDTGPSWVHLVDGVSIDFSGKFTTEGELIITAIYSDAVANYVAGLVKALKGKSESRRPGRRKNVEETNRIAEEYKRLKQIYPGWKRPRIASEIGITVDKLDYHVPED